MPLVDDVGTILRCDWGMATIRAFWGHKRYYPPRARETLPSDGDDY